MMRNDAHAGSRRAAWLIGLLVATFAVLPMSAQEATEPNVAAVAVAEPAAAEPPVRDLLDSIREDLVQLRFEKALAAIEALLGRPGMTLDERAEALILRSQVHVAFGDLDAAESGYREILAVRPGYRPDLSLTPTKAMERYNKVVREMIGRIQLVLDPPDAVLWVDDVQRVPSPTGLLPVLAGDHTLKAQRAGFDPDETRLNVPADTDVPVEMRLVPNARTVVVRTEPDGVEVLIDGVSAGRTARAEVVLGAGAPAAELMIENVPLGDHEYELSRECYRTERLRDSLTVDLLDRTPKIYKPVRLLPASSSILLQGGPVGADVLLDEESVGRLPLAELKTCPGRRTLEIRLDGRRIVRETLDLREAEERQLAVEPKPNLVLIGVEEWPSALTGFSNLFNILEGPALDDERELERVEGWQGLELPLDTDLALAVRRARALGAEDRWYLYSPLLGQVVRLERAPANPGRPEWLRAGRGLATVDSLVGGGLRVVSVREGGPAAAVGILPGDRIVQVGGQAVEGRPDLARALEGAGMEPVAVQWRRRNGETGEGSLSGTTGPFLAPVPEEIDAAMIRAAWASVDALADDAKAAAALANLARILSAFGRHELAIQRWRRVNWGERAGVGEGTRQYYLGLELELGGDEAAAVAAYRKAAASRATAIHDDGPPVAPAARDRLADLGVSTD